MKLTDRIAAKAEFFELLEARLEQGAIEYGDRSFSAECPTKLIDEINEELIDIVGWAVPLHARLLQLRSNSNCRRRGSIASSQTPWR